MNFYPRAVREYFLRPLNVGEAQSASAVGDTGSLVCGAALRLSLQIDADARTITDAKFRAAGCGYLIAAACVLTERLKGSKVSEAASLVESDAFSNAVIEQLVDVPPDRRHCIALCHDTLAAALDNYHETAREEWTGEEALICTCFGVSEKSIERVIGERSLRTIAEVTRACNAGGGCHSCHPLIEDILEDYWRTKAANGSG
ncbi:MAG: NifU-like protein [Blastocatellia bacterium]|jgi:NifU-like protein|nr:NifU-like protein [Blastocatellia bacterium]